MSPLSTNNQANSDLCSGKLPTLSVESLYELFASGRDLATPVGAAQSRLPPDVVEALSVLQEPLSKATRNFGASLVDGVTLLPDAGSSAALEFCSQLRSALKNLYFPESETPPKEYFSEAVQAAFAAIHEHFELVARGLQAEGYQKFCVVPMRDSLGDFWHIHSFLTYILYCGRIIGTEVVTGPPDIDNLMLPRCKDLATPKTQSILSFYNHDVAKTISDTRMGLLLPPLVPHRARRAPLSELDGQANLALGLAAF